MVYINRLFNPQSYLTAIKQIKGSTEGLELNKLTTITQVTAMTPPEITAPPPKRDGAYIFGLFVEGARYDYNTKQLEDSLPKQMFSLVPGFAEQLVNWGSCFLARGHPHLPKQPAGGRR